MKGAASSAKRTLKIGGQGRGEEYPTRRGGGKSGKRSDQATCCNPGVGSKKGTEDKDKDGRKKTKGSKIRGGGGGWVGLFLLKKKWAKSQGKSTRPSLLPKEFRVQIGAR